MILLHRAADSAEAAAVVQMLEMHGISSAAVGGLASGIFGETAADSLQVDVLVSTEDAETARRILDLHYFKASDTEANWTCIKCGESNEGNFEVCWKCQRPRGDQ